MFILQGMCLHHTTNGKANKGHLPNARNRQHSNVNLSSLQSSLSRAELVVEQKCGKGDEDAIIIQNRVKHLITSPGFPDMYPRNAL